MELLVPACSAGFVQTSCVLIVLVCLTRRHHTWPAKAPWRGVAIVHQRSPTVNQRLHRCKRLAALRGFVESDQALIDSKSALFDG